MTSRLNPLGLAALLLLAPLGAAHAQSAGQWMAKIGPNNISPQVSSGDLSAPSQPGTQIDVKSATSVVLTGTLMLTDQVSAELFLGLPYEHEVVGAGTIAGVGKLGTVKQVSPTAMIQYRLFEPSATLRPYAGVGLTYARFYGSKGTGTLTALTNPGGPATRLTADAAWGPSLQLGASFKLSERWFLDATVIKTWIKTTNHLSTGQSIETKLDPLSMGLTIGYRY
jgi:outer membrane protein